MTQKRFDRLIIHAGMLKTGSTTIQAALFNSKMRDATYLDLDMQNQSVACRLMWGDGLTSEMFHRVNGLNQERALQWKQGLEKRLEQQLRTAQERTLVMSAEWFSRVDVPTLEHVRERLAPHVQDFQVYTYIRRPDDFMTSMFQQIVKVSAANYLNLVWPGYKKFLAPLDQVFGQENVHFRLFNRKQFPDGNVVADFRDWTGLPQLQADQGNRNTAFSAAATVLLACYRRHNPDAGSKISDSTVKHLIMHLKTLKAPKLVLHPDLLKKRISAQQKDVEWMESRIGHSITASQTQIPDDAVVIGSEADLKRAAARFSPMLTGDAPCDPPDDPEEAETLAWSRISAFVETLQK